MKKRSLLPLTIGAAVLAAAAYLVTLNLGGRLAPGGGTAQAPSAIPPAARAAATTAADGPAGRAEPATPSGQRLVPGAGQNPDRASQPGAERRRRQSHPVEVVSASIGTLTSFVKLTGEVVAANRVTVYPDVAGKVDRVQVNVGSAVGPQTVLLTVDPSRPGTRYEPSPVRSPIAGTVVDLLVKPGQAVATSTPTITVATVGDLELVVRVPERYAAIVTSRTTGRVSFDAAGAGSFDAPVKRLQPVIDPVSRSKEVVFAVPAGVGSIEPGMFGSVEVVSKQVGDAVVLPFETIVQEAEHDYVFVALEGAAAKRQVEIGMLSGEMVEIRNGIRAGEAVVVSGQTFLEDGSPITVVARTAERIDADRPLQ